MSVSPLDESSIFCGECDELTIIHNATKNLTLLFNRVEQVINESSSTVSCIYFFNSDLYRNNYSHRVGQVLRMDDTFERAADRIETGINKDIPSKVFCISPMTPLFTFQAK